MLRKLNSQKRSISSYKFKKKNDIINKLENLYQQSLKKIEYSNQMDAKEILFKDLPKFNKKLNKFQRSSSSNQLEKRNNKNIRYISIDSIIKKNPQDKSQSNEPPTLEESKKFNSPGKNKISINFNSSTKYKLKPDIKTNIENKNSKQKKEIIIIDNNENNYNKISNISLHSNAEESNNFKNFKEKKNQKKNDKNEFNNYDKYLIRNKSAKMINNKNEKENNDISEYNNKNNKILHLSHSESSLSYKDEKKYSSKQNDYYSSMFDKLKIKKREEVFQSSIQFYLHNQKCMSKNTNFKNKEYIDFSKNRPKVFSEIKRIPDEIAFGKVVPKESINIQKQNKNHSFKPRKILGNNNYNKNLFRKGLINNNSIKKLIESKLIKDDYNTNNPKTEFYIPKDQFGNIVYPVYGQKKMLKNILPKEYDYNTKSSPLELLHETYHPLLRYQKKLLSQHINAINQEIGVAYSKHFTLVDKSKIPEKYQMCQELIDLQKDEKLIRLIRELIDRNFGLEKEVAKTLDLQKKEKENLRKKKIYKRFCEIMLKASIHFKRLNISLEDFYSIPNYVFTSQSKNETNGTGEITNNKERESDTEEILKHKQVLIQKNGQYFFKVIKAGNNDEIIKLMNDNYFIMFYRDHFLQSPLHILAKRNLYQFISLFISRGADINSQDEGGRTALFIAAQNNHLEFVTILLFEIADPSIKNIKGERAFEVTTNLKIKISLERAKILHYFHKIGKIQQFNESIKNGLIFLYKDELGINFEDWLNENKEIMKESEK